MLSITPENQSVFCRSITTERTLPCDHVVLTQINDDAAFCWRWAAWSYSL